MAVHEVRLAWLQGWIAARPEWSRKALAKELCRCWDWRDDRRRPKDFAARSFLLKAEARGWLRLPPLRERFRGVRRAVTAPPDWSEPPPQHSTLRELGPVSLSVITPGTPAARRWAFLRECYHYLKYRVVGENLGYPAADQHGRDVACLLFGAAAWRCRARDCFPPFQAAAPPLSAVANHTRFLILPWVRVPHLASQLLGRLVARIDRDWRAMYGHGLQWLETFVETGRYRGTCYQAANGR